MVVKHSTFVAAGDHHKGTVLRRAIFDHDTHCEDIVVGVRVKRPVLVPADFSVRRWVLEIEFGVIEANSAVQQLRHGFDNGTTFGKIPEYRIQGVRIF